MRRIKALIVERYLGRFMDALSMKKGIVPNILEPGDSYQRLATCPSVRDQIVKMVVLVYKVTTEESLGGEVP